MTTSDDNPYAPPSYPPPSGPALPGPVSEPFAVLRPPSGPALPATLGPVSEAGTASPFDTTRLEPPRSTHKGATLALVLALLTPILTPLSGIAGFVTGQRALKDIAATGERGAGRARAAMWLGACLAVAWVLVVAFVLAAMAGSKAA